VKVPGREGMSRWESLLVPGDQWPGQGRYLSARRAPGRLSLGVCVSVCVFACACAGVREAISARARARVPGAGVSGACRSLGAHSAGSSISPSVWALVPRQHLSLEGGQLEYFVPRQASFAGASFWSRWLCPCALCGSTRLPSVSAPTLRRSTGTPLVKLSGPALLHQGDVLDHGQVAGLRAGSASDADACAQKTIRF